MHNHSFGKFGDETLEKIGSRKGRNRRASASTEARNTKFFRRAGNVQVGVAKF